MYEPQWHKDSSAKYYFKLSNCKNWRELFYVLTCVKYNMDLIQKDKWHEQPTEGHIKTNLHWSLQSNSPTAREEPLQPSTDHYKPEAYMFLPLRPLLEGSAVCCHWGSFIRSCVDRAGVNPVRLKPKTNTGSWVDRKDVRASHCTHSPGHLRRYMFMPTCSVFHKMIMFNPIRRQTDSRFNQLADKQVIHCN